jgi:predicted polyphosphate/ATP-dependent NAD kinase
MIQPCNARRGGTIFGCGNQQLSPHVVQTLGRDNIIVIAALDRLHALDGPPRVDTGDRECHRFLAGSVRVITGEGERAICQVAP